MILDPVNSITSIGFYKKVAGQGLLRTFGYLCYLSAIFAVIGTVALKVKVGPVVDSTFRWLEAEVPTLTFAGGKVSSSQTEFKTIKHPDVPQVAFAIDVSRSEPVTPKDMEDAKVIGWLTSGALYMTQQPGRVEVYDFSKSPTLEKPVVIDAGFFRQANGIVHRLMIPLSLFISFLVFLVWKGFASLFYSLLALAINAVLGAGLAFGSLFTIAVYAQTLVVALQALSLFFARGLPGMGVIALAATGAYIWLAIKKMIEPPAPAVVPPAV